MSSKRELREAIRRWAETTFAISRQRDEARAERDDIRDQLAQAIAEREEMAQEVIAAHRERDNLRADLAQARLDLLDPAPEPRPFRVGDRVRVAEGATFRHGGERKRSLSTAGGCDGTVVDTYYDGDIGIRRDGVTHVSVTSPEFCTLIEDEPEVVLPLPEGYTFENMAEPLTKGTRVIRDLSDELQATRAELAAVRSERDDALDRLAARDASDPLTTPEPRPFRVGDRVRVSEGATFRVGSSGNLTSKSAGRVGVVSGVWSDGDLIIKTEAESGCASPEFCTLIEPAVEEVVESPTCPAAANLQGEHIACDATVPHQVHGSRSAGLIWSGPAGDGAPDGDAPTPQPVTLTLPDGTTVTFDAVVTR